MKRSRRNFIKTGGISLLGIGCGAPVLAALAKALTTRPHEGALAGKRWALALDIAKCHQKEGCRACMDTCHTIHNVPDMENPRHEIKWIWKESFEHAFPIQYHSYPATPLQEAETLVLCNHCERPPCVRVCPTQATWRREDGLVMMDQHRCIGCRYCIAACPYGARSFNYRDPREGLKKINARYPTRTKGVVEKCNLCAERLATGKIPACVEACEKNGAKALVFGDLKDPDSDVARLLAENHTIRRKPSLGTEPHVFYVT